MSLFSRRKRAADTLPESAPDTGDDTAATDATDPDGTVTTDDMDDTDAAARPAPGGPHDVADVPDLGTRLDLGALRIPARAGMQLRLEVEKKTRSVVAVTLGLSGSAMQLQVFAAPRSTGIWSELRQEITASVSKQGGTCDEVTGPFGRELITRLPVKTSEGQPAHRPARFLGVDGPRWFLRAVLTGKSAVDPAAAAELESVLADVVVVRGSEARAPRDVLLLHAPGKPAAPTPAAAAEPGLDPLRRGPEITEVR